MVRNSQRSSLRIFLPDEEGLCIMLNPLTSANATELNNELQRLGFSANVSPHLMMATEEVKQVLEAMQPYLTFFLGAGSILKGLQYLADITLKPFSEAFFGELGRRVAGNLGELTQATAAATRAAADNKPASVRTTLIYDGPTWDVLVECGAQGVPPDRIESTLNLAMFINGAVVRCFDEGILPADKISFVRIKLDSEGRPIRGHTTGDKGGRWELDTNTLQWTETKNDLR